MRNINEQHVAWVDGVEMEKDPKWQDNATWGAAQLEDSSISVN
jgi:hypothetical protein